MTRLAAAVYGVAALLCVLVQRGRFLVQGQCLPPRTECLNRPLYECSLHLCTRQQLLQPGVSTSKSKRNVSLDFSDDSDNISAISGGACCGVYGTIPPILGSIGTILTGSFWFGPENQLSGTIPRSLGSLTALKRLQLVGLGLVSGTLPASLGSLAQLRELHLVNLGTTGTLPSSLGSLDDVVELSLKRLLSLTSVFPESMCNLNLTKECEVKNVPLACPVPDCPRLEPCLLACGGCDRSDCDILLLFQLLY